MDIPTPLKIALVMATPGTGWGGMEKHTEELARSLSALGHHVHVLAHPAYRDHFAPPVQFQPVPFQLGRRNLLLQYRLRQLLRTIRPDIAHAQGSKAASLVSAGRRSAKITVGTVHGTKTSHRAFDRLDGVIGVSREITRAVKHPCTRLIYNGMRPPINREGEASQATRTPIPRERPLLLAAGRLEPVKQFDRLIRAWAHSGLPGSLVILGNGSQRTRLKALIHELGHEQRILLPGHEPNILPWLQAATACVISSDREGFPYVLVEALMAGCPVLSTPVSGVGDFLPESCIACSASVEDLTTLIARWMETPEQLGIEQEESFRQARLQLSLEAMVSKTEAFYRELLARIPAGPR